MDIIFPDRETAIKNGWKYQVQWIEDGRPCFVRYASGAVADQFAAKVRRWGYVPVVTDLRDAMQIN